MALVWQCDRCDQISDMGSVDDDMPPEDWTRRTMPVRGSEGMRSNFDALLCSGCDDDLYRWLHEVTVNG